jgi:hypothetical protein
MSSRSATEVDSVWLVWDGEWEATLASVHTTEAGARQAAHELRKQYRFGKHDIVTVEERTLEI